MPDAKPSDPSPIICCAAGMPDAPGNYPKGRYLAWVHGWFVPCCQPAVATRYLPHQVKAWDGWKIINAGPDVGKLYDSKNTGEMFSPPEIRAARWVGAERDAWQRRAEKAEARAAELETENIRLRQLFNEQGVTAELRQMQDKLAAMLDTIGMAEIIDYKPAAAAQRLDKAA